MSWNIASQAKRNASPPCGVAMVEGRALRLWTLRAHRRKHKPVGADVDSPAAEPAIAVACQIAVHEARDPLLFLTHGGGAQPAVDEAGPQRSLCDGRQGRFSRVVLFRAASSAHYG